VQEVERDWLEEMDRASQLVANGEVCFVVNTEASHEQIGMQNAVG
jgi:hypothetical protein